LGVRRLRLLSILAFASLSLMNSIELASAARSRAVSVSTSRCFWGIRLVLQGIFDVKPHLTTWWLKLGYLILSLLFAAFTVIYGWARGVRAAIFVGRPFGRGMSADLKVRPTY